MKGAEALKSMNAPPSVTIAGVILLSATVNLLIGSASAKWAMLSPIFVPMLMLLGISPEFTQAAYRVGDSTTNIITPMMPYFPLVVVFCQRYVKNTGIGTVTSLMLPYSMSFLCSGRRFCFCTGRSACRSAFRAAMSTRSQQTRLQLRSHDRMAQVVRMDQRSAYTSSCSVQPKESKTPTLEIDILRFEDVQIRTWRIRKLEAQH